MRFGPAGCDESYPGKQTDIPAYLAQHGLTAFEVQCGRGVRTGEDAAKALRANAGAADIALSVHAPYFISLTNPERTTENIEYLRQSARLAGWLGARRVVVHTGAVMGLPRETALRQAYDTMKAVLQTSAAEAWPDVIFCLETMGKTNQLGTLDEVLTLCREHSQLLPCVDFGHLYARTHGKLDGEEAFAQVLDRLESELGQERARETHVHFSKIAYTAGGESKHLIFSDEGGPTWLPLARLLKEKGYRSTVICESRGTQTRDAAEMKRVYEEAAI